MYNLNSLNSSFAIVLDRYLATVNQASDFAKANDVSVGIGFFRDGEYFAYSQDYVWDFKLPIYGDGDLLVATIRPDGSVTEGGLIVELRNEAFKLDESKDLEAYESMLDDCYPLVRFGDLTYLPSQVLKAVDPTAFRCGFLDYMDAQERN